MIRRPPRSTRKESSAASDVYKRQSKLNAILGTTMNSMELMAAKEDDRIVLLKKGLEASGQQFDALSRHEKQAIAASLSMSDMNEVSKLFNAQGSAFDSTADSMSGVTAESADMAGATDAATSAQEKMALIMEQMAIAVMPLIDLLHGFIDAVMVIVGPVFKVINAIVDFLVPAFKY